MPRPKNQKTIAPTQDEIDDQQEIAQYLLQFADDPYQFVMACYPWGEKGTPLEAYSGPDEWQTEELKYLAQTIQDNKKLPEHERTAIKIAYRSGHGVGKTAFLVWITHWFMSTRPTPQLVVTAGTLEQLSGKTWRELAKWKDMALNGDWFVWTATKYYFKEKPETWAARAVPWSVQRSEAFAGTHEKHVLMIFDEGSAIERIIYEVAEGAMTTPGAIWIVVGNPTRNSGAFYDNFHKFAHRWHRRQIDARTARMANKKQIEQWIEDYGADSDFARVRIYGQFPRASSSQFFSAELIEKCKTFKAVDYERYPVVIGVDVARFGDDKSVVTVRQGRKIVEKQRYHHIALTTLAEKVAETRNYYHAQYRDAGVKVYIVIDGVGVGGGVVDILRAKGFQVIDVISGATADDPETYYNKKAEMYSRLRLAMQNGIEMMLPNGQFDIELEAQMLAIEYGLSNKNQLQIEKKEDTKVRLGYSPDDLDSLGLTYAVNLNDAVVGVADIIAGNSFRKIGGGMTTIERWRKQRMHHNGRGR